MRRSKKFLCPRCGDRMAVRYDGPRAGTVARHGYLVHLACEGAPRCPIEVLSTGRSRAQAVHKAHNTIHYAQARFELAGPDRVIIHDQKAK